MANQRSTQGLDLERTPDGIHPTGPRKGTLERRGSRWWAHLTVKPRELDE